MSQNLGLWRHLFFVSLLFEMQVFGATKPPKLHNLYCILHTFRIIFFFCFIIFFFFFFMFSVSFFEEVDGRLYRNNPKYCETGLSKQCRPWSDAAFCGVWSGTIHCLTLIQQYFRHQQVVKCFLFFLLLFFFNVFFFFFFCFFQI